MDRQLQPFQYVLDRVKNPWGDIIMFTIVTAQSITRICSDHNPSVVDTGSDLSGKLL